MESEDMISRPTVISGDSRENNELLKSELEPGEVVAQHSNFEGEEGAVLVDSGRFDEGDTGTKKSASDLDLSDNDIRTERHAKGSDDFELNEAVIKSERSTIQKMGLHESNNEIEGAAKDNSGVDAVRAVPESRTVPDTLLHDQDDVRNEDGQLLMETEVEMDLVDSPVRQVDIELADTVILSENLSSFGFRVNAQNGYLDSQNNVPVHKRKHCGSVSGVKRARVTYDGQQPSVHVTYNSLTRASKQKLEELLLQWSEWHAQHRSSSQDSNEVLESGEDTYYPALWVGMEKSSSVSFWIENQTKKEQSGDLLPESGSVPLYDRGFVLGLTSADAPNNVEGGLEIVGEAARCFNCGSYSHSLKECPKPRDNAAVNHARKQHKSKRNQNAGSRNATRYYQNSSGGKYDGLKPGSLDAETRRVLGLGELDPPPWLNRMRELGYPPGYLDTEDEDQPSGITIFANEDAKEEQEDGEILETEPIEPTKKMAVEFPGVNAPIPENADERAWAAGPSSYDPYRKRSHHRSDYSSESSSRRHHHEQRASRDSIDDGPPVVNSVFSPPASSYPPRYGNYDSTPSFARSYSDRGRRNPLVYDDLGTHSASPYSSSKRSSPWEKETDDRWRPRDDSSGWTEHEANERQSNYGETYSYRSNDEHDRHRHHSWR